jgi:xylulokinase
MTRDQMPALVEGSREGGQLRPALRDRWGIAQDVTVAGGGGDNAAAACGAGCLAEGQGFVSLGTSGVLLAARDGFAPDPETAVHTFCHALPGRWYQMGVILAATDCLNWLARQTGQPAAALAGALPERADGPGALTFLPYLSGERTPHNDAALRGAFVGLDVAHGPEDLTRAVVEGVSFALRDCLAALEGTGASLGSVVAMGGGARSAFWLETLASVLNLPLEVPEGGEFGAALGAARLARLAVTGEAPEGVITPPAIGRVVEPVAGSVDAYGEAWQRYRSLAGAVKAHMAG